MEWTKTKTVRLLLVDDDQDIREPIAQWGSTHGWDCLLAGDKATALNTIQTEQDISACVLDIRLGNLNTGGLDVLRAFRDKFPGTPVVLLTGNNQELMRALWYGASLIVRKPIPVEHLLAIVKSQIDTLHALGSAAAEQHRLRQLERYFDAMGVGVAVLDGDEFLLCPVVH